MNIDELKRLTKTERLQAMEALWDAMLYDEEDIETPEWHERILEQRKEMIANGSAKFVSLRELRAIRNQ